MFYFNIALKSILERRRQYKSLFAVCAVGVTLMLSALMVTDGMLASMNEKARQYYGGDLQLLGGKHLSNLETDSDNYIQVLSSALEGENVVVSKRYNYDARNESYYFEGTSVRQRVIMGVEFENEKALFDKFTFTEGTFLNSEYEDTVIISQPIAKKLGCHVGDSITLYVTTSDGYKNTMDFVVIGVFQDSSVFGMYTSYVNYNSLMKILTIDPPQVNRISIYYPDGSPSFAKKQRLQKNLESKFLMYPLGMDKNKFYDDFFVNAENQGIEKFALISLDSNVSDLKLLVQALRLVVAAIIVMLAIIIAVGISSTYRVIVIKRNVESGTLRALGMKPSGIMRLFITEAFVLLVTGCFTGFVFSLIIAKVVSTFNLSFISGFDLFLTGGYLLPHVNGIKITGLVAAIIVTTLVSVLFTLRKLVHVSPVGAITATT
ncbi:ABC transporter permease [Treponema sp.]|uniref:ABC transporter permease n=1 Tax=Treponema sp. TaxID=166 RepID=UPI00298EAA91|nr:ABC transporter permease [Treponema sp.]MCR5612882.1 ABC transporter permease [Treponema sp.]